MSLLEWCDYQVVKKSDDAFSRISTQSMSVTYGQNTTARAALASNASRGKKNSYQQNEKAEKNIIIKIQCTNVEYNPQTIRTRRKLSTPITCYYIRNKHINAIENSW